MTTSDFRSDTVTAPSEAMRAAMASAEVGDDVFGDDPSVNAFERELASAFGTEAALFLPSGTMANICAIRAHTRPGDEIIVEEQSHIFRNEQAASAWICGVQAAPLPSDRGRLDPELVAATFRDEDIHHPRTTLVAVENTHNYQGGAVVPLDRIEALAEVAHARGAALHIDGARLWNASVASGTPLREYGRVADSIMVAFSKGLGCPAGSGLVGSAEVIARARRTRKGLGGGMRQVGVLTEPMRLALRDGIERLAEDHRNARTLAEGLNALAGVTVDLDAVETNIVFVRPPGDAASWPGFVEGLGERGVRCCFLGVREGVRFVTHLDVGADDVARAIAAARELVEGGGGAGS